jgi:cellulose synthase (UDP-forming)
MRWRRADGNWQCGELTAYSQAEAVFTARNAGLAVDDRLEVELEHEETIARVTGRVHAVSADSIEIALSFETLEQERLYNRCTFARRGMWAIAPEGKVDDRLHKGYLLLMRLALYGYRSMIEFLPARLSWLRSGVRWIAGLMPRLPKI